MMIRGNRGLLQEVPSFYVSSCRIILLPVLILSLQVFLVLLTPLNHHHSCSALLLLQEQPQLQNTHSSDSRTEQEYASSISSEHMLLEEESTKEQTQAPQHDDRSLLEVFGETAKDFLTHHVIPPTDAECHFDWRSLRCEPHCQCRVQLQWGDYHLGRACRRDHVHDSSAASQLCQDTDPRDYLLEKPFIKRTWSLLRQSTQLTLRKTRKILQQIQWLAMQIQQKTTSTILAEQEDPQTSSQTLAHPLYSPPFEEVAPTS